MATTAAAVSSFSNALVLGEIHDELVFPYPAGDAAEADRVRELIRRFREFAAANVDSRRIDDERWIPDGVFAD